MFNYILHLTLFSMLLVSSLVFADPNQQVNSDAMNELQNQAQAAFNAADYQVAESYLEQALTVAPQSPQLHSLAAKIYSEIAQNASVFAALSYAKKAAVELSLAVNLEPQNIEYRQDYMNFHLLAPSAAGGDKSIALAQAEAIKLLNSRSGYIAYLHAYGAIEDKQSLHMHIKNLPVELAKDAEVLFTIGLLQQKYEQYQNAFESFQSAISAAGDNKAMHSVKYGALYQLGRTSVLSHLHTELALNALKQYISEAPDLEQLPSREWAEYRLANLLEHMGKRSEAKSIYQVIANITPDLELKKQIATKL